MPPETINAIAVLFSVVATILTAIVSFRSSEKSSYHEGVRTNLEVKRFDRESGYDQVIQGAQTLNVMSTGLLDFLQNRLRETEASKKELEDQHDHLISRNIELTMTLGNMARLSDGLDRILEMEDAPNGCRDRILRLKEISNEVRTKGLLQ